MRQTIGESLITAGLITQEDLAIALAEHKCTGERLGVVLARLNLATETQIAQALAFQLGFPYVDLAEEPPDPRAVALVPKDVALEHVVVAVQLERGLLTVAMADPLVLSLVQDLEHRTGHRIRQVVSTRSDILAAIHAGYPETVERESSDETSERADAAADDGHVAPIADLADLVVKSAIASHAADLHVEPTADGLLIRHRLDGVLQRVMTLPASVQDALIARLKAMAGMDTAETRLPQDGRLRARSDDGSHVEVRVSTLRTLYGERIVMRVHDRQKSAPALDEIGIPAASLELVRGFLRRPHGLMLVAGPAGSGRTTTLSSALGAMRSDARNIVTIEDPIEYRVPGVSQTQIDENAALTFATALRSALLQDPDVILLGEIRDAQSTALAMQAASTGRLVLSTLLAENAPSAVTRLLDFGAEPGAIASALVGVVAQRLVRRLCMHCRRQYTPTLDTLRLLDCVEADADTSFYQAVGCNQCNHTGYRGRVGIFEVMQVTDALREQMSARAPERQLRETAIAGGMVTLAEDGLAQAKIGTTTPEELLRAVADARQTRTLCTGCGAAVGVDFVACPRCGQRLGGGCPHCGRSLRPDWQFCPYCARSVPVVRAPAAPRETDARAPRRGPTPADFAAFKKHRGGPG